MKDLMLLMLASNRRRYIYSGSSNMRSDMQSNVHVCNTAPGTPCRATCLDRSHPRLLQTRRIAETFPWFEWLPETNSQISTAHLQIISIISLAHPMVDLLVPPRCCPEHISCTLTFSSQARLPRPSSLPISKSRVAARSSLVTFFIRFLPWHETFSVWLILSPPHMLFCLS